jgi:hypothetical protein
VVGWGRLAACFAGEMDGMSVVLKVCRTECSSRMQTDPLTCLGERGCSIPGGTLHR